MSDKLRQGISVLTSFSDGEQPTAAKLNSITAQLRHAAEQLEEAVGDIHGQSWPYSSASNTTLSQKHDRNLTTGVALTSTAERQLDIANIGRLIGPASNLNPRMQDSSPITESVPVGVHEFSLRYPPVDGTVSFTESVPTAFITEITVAANMANAGEYHVTSSTTVDDVPGKIYTVTATVGGTVTYTTDPLTYGGGQAPSYARHNVIPDLNQISGGGTGLSFSAPDGNGRRTATLPTATYAQSNYLKTNILLDNSDALKDVQLKLPKVLVDNFINGDTIPPGYLFLKNVTTGEVYEDAEYLYGSETTFLVGNVDLTTEINRGDKFVCLTVGSDITTAIDDLRVKSFHTHDRTYGEPLITLDGISGFTEKAGNKGAFIPSEIPGNFAPQYLHRDGYDVTKDSNLNDRNCMRGDLLLGLAGGSAGSYTTGAGTGETFKLRFGTANTFIYRDSSDDLVIGNGGSIGNDVVIRQIGTSSGGVLVTEEGVRGIRGAAGNAAHVAVVTGVLPSALNVNQSVDIATPAGLQPGDDVYGISFLVNISGTNWAPPGQSDPSDLSHYTIYWEDGPQTVRYQPQNIALSTTSVPYRAVIWYRP